jgi:hypothetical protein
LSIKSVTSASASWTDAKKQRAKHTHKCIQDSLSNDAVLLLDKHKGSFEDNGPLLSLFVMKKLAKPMLGVTKELKLKRGLTEEALRKKVVEVKHDVSLFETCVLELQLEIAQWNTGGHCSNHEHCILQALTNVKSTMFQCDVMTLNKANRDRLKQLEVDGIEANEMTSTEALESARETCLHHIQCST